MTLLRRNVYVLLRARLQWLSVTDSSKPAARCRRSVMQRHERRRTEQCTQCCLFHNVMRFDEICVCDSLRPGLARRACLHRVPSSSSGCLWPCRRSSVWLSTLRFEQCERVWAWLLQSGPSCLPRMFSRDRDGGFDACRCSIDGLSRSIQVIDSSRNGLPRSSYSPGVQR